jgi:hypothetical protein
MSIIEIICGDNMKKSWNGILLDVIPAYMSGYSD